MKRYLGSILPCILFGGCLAGCVTNQETNGGTRVRKVVVGWPLTIEYHDTTTSEKFVARDEITSSLTDGMKAKKEPEDGPQE